MRKNVAEENREWVVLFALIAVILWGTAWAMTQAIVTTAQVLGLTSGELTLFGFFSLVAAGAVYFLYVARGARQYSFPPRRR